MQSNARGLDPRWQRGAGPSLSQELTAECHHIRDPSCGAQGLRSTRAQKMVVGVNENVSCGFWISFSLFDCKPPQEEEIIFTHFIKKQTYF